MALGGAVWWAGAVEWWVVRWGDAGWGVVGWTGVAWSEMGRSRVGRVERGWDGIEVESGTI